MNTQDAVSILSCLAQEARLEIFRLLVQNSPAGLAAGEIAKRLNIPASTLSFHLKELSHAGLIKSEQSSRFIYYSTDFQAINALVGYLMENCCGTDKNCCDPLI
ncbi:MAG: transcriptional regulator [Betaproteobacteria bacterium HGW-Betaproteobacteria-1]|jgi:DNA-binding transcriptional ArsR family regulator|nr:MAG: transcriptional regulator [Betaproteobacteria bacterium HGW-Betaproteobacteria-1]